jgi:endonuclease YncB( thermonuclease family)
MFLILHVKLKKNKMPKEYRYPVLSYRVIDGDSVECVLDRGFDDTKTLNCRMMGIDAPDVRTKAGVLVKDVCSNWIEVRSKDLWFHSVKKEKHACRSLGYLYHGSAPGVSLSVFLLTYQLVRPYDGTIRKEWHEAELEAIIERVFEIAEEEIYAR